MTREQLIAKFGNCSESFLRANSAGDSRVRADHQKPTQGDALVRVAPRKGKGRKGAVLGVARRRSIVLRVFSTHPPDWDGISCKEIQDCLVHAGLLDGDDWHLLYGTVISEKVHTKEEERTEIELT